MRTDRIRVKKPAWVRIVNPEPFTLLDRTYRYGERLLVHPGGLFRVLREDGFMALAAYEAPHPPVDEFDCPSLALTYRPVSDLRLLAEGKLDDESDPCDPRMTESFAACFAPSRVRSSQKARVPRSRTVRAMPPATITTSRAGSPYRAQEETTHVQLGSRWAELRPGGTLTATEIRGPRLKAVYFGNPDFRGEQCADGSWFWMSEFEFVSMEARYVELRRLEESERQEVLRVLG